MFPNFNNSKITEMNNQLMTTLFCPSTFPVHFKCHGHNVIDPSLKFIVLLDTGHSFGGPGENEVSLLQRDDLADVVDEIRDGEDHLGCAAILFRDIVDLQPQIDAPRVWDLLLRDEVTDGTGGVEGFGKGPGKTFGLAFVLGVPSCHIQAQHISSHMLHS